MCDIYRAKCAECETHIETHLSDYNTDRGEVVVLCHEHAHLYQKHGPRVMFWLDNFAAGVLRLIKHPQSETNFFGSDEPFVAVISLTDNAWKNRMGNHPNSGTTIPISDLEKFESWMEVWSRALYSEEGDWNPDGIGTDLAVARDEAISVYEKWYKEATKGWRKKE